LEAVGAAWPAGGGEDDESPVAGWGSPDAGWCGRRAVIVAVWRTGRVV